LFNSSSLAKRFANHIKFFFSVRTKSRVFNGQDARLGYFPHQVSMSIDGEFECGGSILNENWILTAAHCVDDLHKVPKIKILAGSITNIENYNGNEPDGQLRDVDCVKWHPNYKGEQNSLFPYDIALLRLSQPLDLKKNNNVRRIEIPNAKHVPIRKDIIYVLRIVFNINIINNDDDSTFF